MSNVVKILSIDGGGVRGLIPALLLARIEELTNRPVSKLFDLIAGTSTGGILSLGLTIPATSGCPLYTAARLADMYRRDSPTIFSRSLWHRFSAWNNLTQEKYPSDGMNRVLQAYFGEANLKDALTNLLIPSYEIERRTPFFFRSANARIDPDYDFPMRDVARAASAAPTYFEPMKLNSYALIDGGVFANNPAACALVEACSMHPGADYLVVSLGTGQYAQSLPYEQAKTWGLAKWAKPILDVVFDGVSSTVDYQLRHLLSPHYYRFQTTLGNSHALDDTTPANMSALTTLAESLIKKESPNLESLCKQLVE